jgi:molybdate transport system regulatory protein
VTISNLSNKASSSLAVLLHFEPQPFKQYIFFQLILQIPVNLPIFIFPMMKKKRSYKFCLRIWIESADGPYLGAGRITLLKNIKRYGSMLKAAKALKMSYRQAWQLVEDMNKQSNKPLVERVTGGKGGGGTKLTPAGGNVVVQYEKLDRRVKEFLKKESVSFRL